MGLTIKHLETGGEAKKEAAKRLADALDHPGKILLLLSGGSSLVVAQEALKKLSKNQKKQITITQVDERYGKPGHKHSNWEGVKKAIGAPEDYAEVVPVLEMGNDIEDVAASYSAKLKQIFNESDIRVGVYGVGADGHVAGMLPQPEEDFFKFIDGRYMVDFKGKDFPRITTTSALFRHLDDMIVFASGSNKKDAIEKLKKKLPVHVHPAQLLKNANQAWVYYGKKK
jgi:6-phosphogluconolactonase/glucosamine-6-phosphate isomerase/deaminase